MSQAATESEAIAHALTIAVPVKALLAIRRLAREGQAPRVAWSEDRGRMDRQAMQCRGDALQAIDSELEPYLMGR